MLQQKNLCSNLMKIRKQTYVATLDLYVATLSRNSLKKKVVTFLCSVATMTFLCSVATMIKENGSKVML